IEKRAYAAAHRRRRVAHAVDEHIYFVSGEPSNEDAGDGWAGALEVHADFFVGHFGGDARRALFDLLLADDIDLLRDPLDRFDNAGIRRYSHFLIEWPRPNDQLQ